MVNQSVPLETLLAGESAIVRRITGPCSDVHRLEEFGLRGGTRVEVFRTGNPCILRVAGGKVCLRSGPAMRILVDRSNEAFDAPSSAI